MNKDGQNFSFTSFCYYYYSNYPTLYDTKWHIIFVPYSCHNFNKKICTCCLPPT
ncbi:hypothetical protein F383_15527 [Gossypium arboreum]|uniref:Uncharacterized protein n=1 Tax=Gossypium arboreum TaxID=29729 RepID=A0A0B0Q032_GOSAR|nr:hypothetical protein F383_15527 [Gossypium arboreum]